MRHPGLSRACRDLRTNRRLTAQRSHRPNRDALLVGSPCRQVPTAAAGEAPPNFSGEGGDSCTDQTLGVGSMRGQNIRGLSSATRDLFKIQASTTSHNTPHVVGEGRSVVNRRLRRHPHSGRGDLPGRARTLEHPDSRTPRQFP
jgi:hypothetical protein